MIDRKIVKIERLDNSRVRITWEYTEEVDSVSLELKKQEILSQLKKTEKALEEIEKQLEVIKGEEKGTEKKNRMLEVPV